MIKENIDKIRNDIETIRDKGFSDSGVKIVAASKLQDSQKIYDAIKYGIEDIGENRVQEFKPKYEEFQGLVNFHLIGSLQTNKSKDVVGKAKLIHSMDRPSLLKEIEKRSSMIDHVQEVLLQINISKEDTKSGLYVDEIDDFIGLVEKCKYVRVKGLMTMAPHYDNPEETRWVFTELKHIFDELSKIEYNNIDMEYLSMGMTHDYKIALECGSNMIRIGSGIFGERVY